MIVCNDPRVSDFCSKRIGYSLKTDSANIGWEKDGKIVSGAVYFDYNGRSITAGIATDVSFARMFIKVIFHYPFVQLNVKRVSAAVEENNHKSHKLLTHFGFEHEAVLTDAGRFGDLHIYRMFRENCKWLEV